MDKLLEGDPQLAQFIEQMEQEQRLKKMVHVQCLDRFKSKQSFNFFVIYC